MKKAPVYAAMLLVLAAAAAPLGFAQAANKFGVINSQEVLENIR